jgi:glycosyltransferase involved in cell wall biosynthesis
VDFPIENCFLYLGRLESRKNLLFLIEAFSVYVRRGGAFQLLLVGPVERRYDEEIHRTIKKCGLSDKVKVLPPIYGESKWSYFSQCRAVVYPAKEEAFGRVAFEAVACGTPPILPKQSGAYDYLQSKLPAAAFYEDESCESLADSLTFFEKNESDLSVAQEWVRTQLDPRAVSQQVINLYRSILLDKR